MPTVTVLRFPSAQGAEEALATVRAMQKQHLIKVHDAAIVSWPVGKKGPSTNQPVNLVTTSAAGGMFWGMLFGLIFFTPFIGLAVGAAVGGLHSAFRDYGIDDEFIRRARGAIGEGTSALFLMSDAVVDRVGDTMRDTPFDLITTNLSKEQERQLREAFAGN